MTASTYTHSVDILVVGSGPAGSTFARVIHDDRPDATILVVDVGPRLTDRAGQNVRNLDPGRREVAQARSQGPAGSERETSSSGQVDGRLAARPGTFLVKNSSLDGDAQRGMPAAAMSSNVGGMSAHWTCACPKPGDSERIPFIDADRFDRAFERAEDLLRVTQGGFRSTSASRRVLELLSAHFDKDRKEDRRVQPMPLACQPRDGGLPWWSGAAEVLGELANPDTHPNFELRDQTICRRLVHQDGRVTGAELEHLPTGEHLAVSVKAAVVAADALRTPQVLWASGIRPAALGRYLNDQPQLISGVVLDVDDEDMSEDQSSDKRDQLTGVLWVPFKDGDHPYHTQVMQFDASPITIGETADLPAGPVVGIGYFTCKDLRAEDRVAFSDDEVDGYGMPAMTIHYDLSDTDRGVIDEAVQSIAAVAEAIGTFLPGGRPRLLPAGSSMHYQGSVRMGRSNDGTSVCDRNSRVWGFSNLYLAGNGVIPTATACNPTATSVALAVLGATELVAELPS